MYATAPLMAILSTRTQLTPELERRRRTEAMRDRLAMAVPYLAGAAAAAVVVLVIGGLVGLGGSHPGATRRVETPSSVRSATDCAYITPSP